jgi:hypothetical protein
VAAATHSGSATFYWDQDSPVEWGASLTQGDWQKNHDGENKTVVKAQVQLLDLPQ